MRSRNLIRRAQKLLRATNKLLAEFEYSRAARREYLQIRKQLVLSHREARDEAGRYSSPLGADALTR